MSPQATSLLAESSCTSHFLLFSGFFFFFRVRETDCCVASCMTTLSPRPQGIFANCALDKMDTYESLYRWELMDRDTRGALSIVWFPTLCFKEEISLVASISTYFVGWENSNWQWHRRKIYLWREVRWWEFPIEAWQTWPSLHGKCGSKHQRIAIFRHHCPSRRVWIITDGIGCDELAWREARCFRRSCWGNGYRQGNREARHLKWKDQEDDHYWQVRHCLDGSIELLSVSRV